MLEQSQILDFIRKIGLAMNAIISYPKDHPMVRGRVEEISEVLSALPEDVENISLVFLENTIIVEDIKIEASTTPLVSGVIKKFKRIGVESITFDTTASQDDIQLMLDMVLNPPKEFKKEKDPNNLLIERGIEGIFFNVVKVAITSRKKGAVIDADGILEIFGAEKGEKVSGGEEGKGGKGGGGGKGVNEGDIQLKAKDEKAMKGLVDSILMGGENSGKHFLEFFKVDADNDNEQNIENLVTAMNVFGEFLIKKYGLDPSSESLVYSRILSALTPKVRDKALLRITKEKEMGEMARKVIDSMSDLDLVNLISSHLSDESNRLNLKNIAQRINETRFKRIIGLLKEKKGINVTADQDGNLNIGAAIIEEARKKESLIIANKMAFDRLKKQLKESLSIKHVSNLVESIAVNLDDDSPDVRNTAFGNLLSLLKDSIESKKVRISRKIFHLLINSGYHEEDPDVFSNYVKGITEMTLMANENKWEDFVSDTIDFFANQINNEKKRPIIINYLPMLKRPETINLLLSILWEKGGVEDVKKAVKKMGAEVIPQLMDLLIETEDKNVRIKLITIISSLKREAVEVVENYLKDKRWFVRRNAVTILGAIGEKDYVDDLKKAGKDEDFRVRIEVLRSVFHIVGAEEENFYIRYLIDPVFAVEMEAARIIKKTLSKKNINVVTRRLLQSKFRAEEENSLKTILLETLKIINDDSLIPVMEQIINEKSIFGYKYPESTRISALEVIGSVKSEEAKKALERIKESKIPVIRKGAEHFLSQFENKKNLTDPEQL